MKWITLLAVCCIAFSSCTTYKELVSVQNRTNISDGTKDIILTQDLETVKTAFTSSGIMLQSMEGGFETEEILLDEGTRAKYKAHVFDNQIRITAFWGITQKVKSEMTVWAGQAAASAYDVQGWDQVNYDNKSSRPKKVFDYAVQVVEANSLQYKLR
jgi:hypothetical protein